MIFVDLANEGWAVTRLFMGNQRWNDGTMDWRFEKGGRCFLGFAGLHDSVMIELQAWKADIE